MSFASSSIRSFTVLTEDDSVPGSFVNIFTCDNGSEKGAGVNENEHTCDPLL